MEITESKKDRVQIFSLKGKLDSVTSPTLRNKVLTAIEKGERQVVIDCAELEFISSAGLRVIIEAGKKLEKLNGTIVCCTATETVRNIFDMVELSESIPVVDTVEEAVRRIGS